MAADFEFSEANGVGEDITDGISNLNFGNDDSANIVVADHPVLRGENSYQKYFKAHFSGTFTEISNMKFWKSAGTLVTGETIEGDYNVAFAEPTTGELSGDTEVPTAVGSAWDIESSGGTATIVAAGYTKYIRLQAKTTAATPVGSANTKTFTFQYDEQ